MEIGQEDIDQMRSVLILLKGIVKDMAELSWQYYEELLKVGFKPEQAVQMIVAFNTKVSG